MKDFKVEYRKVLNIANSVFESKWFYLIMLPLAIMFVTIYSYTTSPFYVNDGMDSCVFKSMGLAILQGKTPYVDFFDHKGPLLYFINAFGQFLIPGRLGIFILQIIAETIIYCSLYKTIRLFLNGTLSICIFAVTLLIYGGLYQEGNQCEEWMLLAIAPAICYTLKIIVEDKIRSANYYGIALGLLFGWTFYIRPNDAVSLIGGSMLGLFLYQMWLKMYKQALVNALYFLLTYTLFSIPFISFFLYRDALQDLYYGLIQYNAMYAGGVVKMLQSCYGHGKMTFFLLLVSMCVLGFNTKDKNALWTLVPITVIAWVITGRNLFPHYLISLLPLIMLFGVFLLCQKNISIVILALCVCYCSAFAFNVNFLKGARNEFKWRINTLRHPKTSFQIAEYEAFYKESTKLLDTIPVQDKDSIWNYNLMWSDYSYFSIFWHNNLLQCNRVPYYPMNMVDEKLKATESLVKNKPKWIVLTHDYDEEMSEWTKWDSDYQYIEEKYSLVAKTDTSICDIELYKRNDQ